MTSEDPVEDIAGEFHDAAWSASTASRNCRRRRRREVWAAALKLRRYEDECEETDRSFAELQCCLRNGNFRVARNSRPSPAPGEGAESSDGDIGR